MEKVQHTKRHWMLFFPKDVHTKLYKHHRINIAQEIATERA